MSDKTLGNARGLNSIADPSKFKGSSGRAKLTGRRKKGSARGRDTAPPEEPAAPLPDDDEASSTTARPAEPERANGSSRRPAPPPPASNLLTTPGPTGHPAPPPVAEAEVPGGSGDIQASPPAPPTDHNGSANTLLERPGATDPSSRAEVAPDPGRLPAETNAVPPLADDGQLAPGPTQPSDLVVPDTDVARADAGSPPAPAEGSGGARADTGPTPAASGQPDVAVADAGPTPAPSAQPDGVGADAGSAPAPAAEPDAVNAEPRTAPLGTEVGGGVTASAPEVAVVADVGAPVDAATDTGLPPAPAAREAGSPAPQLANGGAAPAAPLDASPVTPHRAVTPGLQRKRRELSVPHVLAEAVQATGINPADVVMAGYRRHRDAIAAGQGGRMVAKGRTRLRLSISDTEFEQLTQLGLGRGWNRSETVSVILALELLGDGAAPAGEA